MADLKTTYMGIGLNNPVMVSSSGITGRIDGIRRCAEAGAGAVVLKSMFEEIISAQAEELDRELVKSEHPEAYDYITAEFGMQMGSKPYLKFIGDAKRAVPIPIIASINCITPKWWVPYAKHIESSGADGLELNITHFPEESGVSSGDIEQRYADIVSEVTGTISIPVAVKLSSQFTAPLNVMRAVAGAGAQALVLFNRFYSVDVNIESRLFINTMVFSSSREMSLPLRWIGLARENLDCSIAGSTGVHDDQAVLKMIMAGADVVQLCSALYMRGVDYIGKVLDWLDQWLTENSFASIADVRGAALKNTKEPNILLKRVQYLKALNEASEYKFE